MKNRTKILVVAGLILVPWLSCLYGQTTLEDRVEAQRIALITERVDLSVEEAQVFWPLYNQYRKDEKRLNKQKAPTQRIVNMDEEEAQAYIDQVLAVEQQLLDIRKAFIADLQVIFSARKTLRFWQAERAFKERLVQMLRRQKNSGR